jgi:hypothetical protein
MPEAGDEFVATRGFGYTMAVRRAGQWVGFVKIEDLGHDSVKAYLAAQVSR